MLSALLQQLTTADIISKAPSRTHPKHYGTIYLVLNAPFLKELAQFIASDAVPASFDGAFLNNVNFYKL